MSESYPALLEKKLQENGTPVEEAMDQFAEWVFKEAGDTRPIFASDNPIFEREFLENLRRDNMGIAVQVTMKLTGAGKRE